MQVIKTAVWIIITAILVSFIAMNWTKVPVNIWPLEYDKFVYFEWPVGIIALLFFLLGFLPMWMLYRALGWRLNRRIKSLEGSLRTAAAGEPEAVATATPPASAPLLTSAAEETDATSDTKAES